MLTLHKFLISTNGIIVSVPINITLEELNNRFAKMLTIKNNNEIYENHVPVEYC